MSGASKKLMGTTAAAGDQLLAIEDVFSTYLYTGNGSSQVIENGIRLGQSNSGGSVDFDGNRDFLSVPSSTDFAFGTGDFTIEHWVYGGSQPDAYPRTVAIGPAYSADSVGTNFDDNDTPGKFAFYARNLLNGRILVSTSNVNDSEWHHVAVTRESGVFRLFIDGVLEATNSSYIGSSVGTAAQPLVIGSVSSEISGEDFAGYIADVRIVKGTALYTANFTPPTEPLTAISGTSLLTCQGSDPFVDNSPNAFTITQNGNPQAATFGPFDAAEPGEGGLVWIKSRSNAAQHTLYDTERGAGVYLRTNSTAANATDAQTLSSFNADGFSLGSANFPNTTNYTYASWTFRKAPRFFDVVTYTGAGFGAQTISHSLGVAPGFMVVKRTNASSTWFARHIKNYDEYYRLNATDAASSYANLWGEYHPTDVDFKVAVDLNESGATYVAYLFAHDPLGPSEDGSDGLIACGSFTTFGANQATINLGWEPQWCLIKRTDNTGSWTLVDNMRQWANGPNGKYFLANLSNAEFDFNIGHPLSDGFFVDGFPTGNYIYIAIRRGPMRAPTSGTEVFALDTQNSGSYSSPPYYRSGFVTDAALRLFRQGGSSAYQWFASRMTGGNNLVTSSTAAEVTNASTNDWDYMNGWGGSGASGSSTVVVSPMFRRAPGFFDVVAYTGNGTAGRTVPHNLGVAPEMMIVRGRSAAKNWGVYHTGLNGSSSPEGYSILLNSANAEFSSPTLWNNTAPTDVVFTLGTNNTVNQSGLTNIAYLFATLAGVSKVGSYTGNGSSQTINCGFTTGARFILIKRTDSTGDWYVWDTARGIVTGNDPFLELNTTDAEVTSDDSIDPDSSGFIVNQTATTNVNVSSASYIYLAIS